MHRHTGSRGYTGKFSSISGIDSSNAATNASGGFLKPSGRAGTDCAVKVSHSADQTLTTDLVLSFDTVIQDNLAEWDSSAGVFTPQETGQYAIGFSPLINSSGDSQYVALRLFGDVGGVPVAAATLITQQYSVASSAGLFRTCPIMVLPVALTSGVPYYIKVTGGNNALVRKASTGYTELSIHRLR